ncbi:MAG: dihydrolipoamide acetyltransferase family protein [Planctomycetota bacterium]|jgi:2-oxoglutarate dehydrogenase E2 component (dihydrolipoamide succinyltransferase)
MATEVVMPQMGESIAEGTITKWMKQVGETIGRDEALLEISTDKVDTEIPSPAAGVLVKIVAEEGATVEVGTVIAIIGAEGETVADTPAPAAKAAAAQQAAPAQQPAPALAPVATAVATAGAPASGIPRSTNGRFYSPLVRSIASAEGVSADQLAGIAGSGAGGRVTKRDLLGWLTTKPAVAAPVLGTAPGDQVVPMDRMRQIIAHHMVESIQTSAHVYILSEADMTGIVEYRGKFKESFLERTGEKLTYTPFFIKATALALRDFPYVNAQMNAEAKQITVKGEVNVGMAVAVPNEDGTFGLIVPVVKNADMLPLKEIARQVNDFAVRGRSGGLKPDEPMGGTFTITNMGVFGSLGGLPVINQPQVGILGLGAIQKKPVVRDGEIVARDIVMLSVGIDHRLVDGALGGQFLERIRYYLENFEEWDLL